MTVRSLFYDIADAFERFYNDNDWFAIFPHVFTMSSYLSSGINKINTILVNSNQKIFREVRLCCLLKDKRTNWDWQITEQLYSFKLCSGADPGEVRWVNFHPPFSESPSFIFFPYPLNIKIIFDFSDTITKIHPPFQNPGSALVLL